MVAVWIELTHFLWTLMYTLAHFTALQCKHKGALVLGILRCAI